MMKWLAVVQKEGRDLSRDKRSLTNIFFMGALLGPILAMAMMSFAIKMAMEEAERVLEIPTQGSHLVPNLVETLKRQKIHLVEVDGDIRSHAQGGEHSVALLVPPDLPDRYSNGDTVFFDVYFDESRTQADLQMRRLTGAIRAWAQQIGSLRLMMRGVAPETVRVAGIREHDLSTGQGGRAGRMLSMLPYFLIIGLIQAAMFVASDITAGERERRTLEPLLINPVSAVQIMTGKIGINILVGCSVLLISSLAFFYGSKMLPVEEIGLVIEASVFFHVAMILLPLVLFVAPLMTFLGSFAKAVREAQTWLSIVILAAMIPSVIQMLLQNQVEGAQLLIPVWSQQYLVNQALQSADISPLSWFLSALGSGALGAVFWWLAIRQYKNPKLLMG